MLILVNEYWVNNFFRVHYWQAPILKTFDENGRYFVGSVKFICHSLIALFVSMQIFLFPHTNLFSLMIRIRLSQNIRSRLCLTSGFCVIVVALTEGTYMEVLYNIGMNRRQRVVMAVIILGSFIYILLTQVACSMSITLSYTVVEFFKSYIFGWSSFYKVSVHNIVQRLLFYHYFHFRLFFLFIFILSLLQPF